MKFETWYMLHGSGSRESHEECWRTARAELFKDIGAVVASLGLAILVITVFYIGATR